MKTIEYLKSKLDVYKQFIGFLNSRKLRKWQKKIKSEYNVLNDFRNLTDSGFTQSQALSIINTINNMK